MIQSEYLRWKKDGGKEFQFVFDGIGQFSTVFDVGLYKGKWGGEIIKRYNPWFYGFEPINEYYVIASTLLDKSPKITILNYGIGESTCLAGMTVDGDASSIMGGKGRHETVSIISLEDVMATWVVDHVDLIGINIEGAEYALLEHMISAGLVSSFVRIFIQFHEIGGRCKERRDSIRKELAITHTMLYSYDTVWDYWVKKE